MEGELYNVQEGLEGELGYKGERGYSAYEIAVLHGFEGSEQDWIDHFGLDLTNYVQTDDVVDNLTSDTTNHPLSAKQGKTLKTLVDSKANTDDTYNKAQVDAMLENINGKVLWVNPSPSSSFAAQTIQLDLSNYDEVEIFYTKTASFVDDNATYSGKLIKYSNTDNLDVTTSTFLNSIEADYQSNNGNPLSDIITSSRNVKWVSNGITFGDTISRAVYKYENDNAASFQSKTATINSLNVPLFIVGRKRNIYDLS